jgi:hypothetical protein
MLVANNKGNFTKKATGRITFTCNDGHLIKEVIERTITKEGQTLDENLAGVNEKSKPS